MANRKACLIRISLRVGSHCPGENQRCRTSVTITYRGPNQTGHLSGAAWSVWIANLLFALNQIHFVHLRIRAAHAVKPNEKFSIGRGFLIGQIVLAALLIIACAGHLFAWYAAMAFLPALCRGFAWFAAGSEPLAMSALGRRELMHAGAFGVLLVLGLQLP